MFLPGGGQFIIEEIDENIKMGVVVNSTRAVLIDDAVVELLVDPKDHLKVNGCSEAIFQADVLATSGHAVEQADAEPTSPSQLEPLLLPNLGIAPF